MYYTNRKKHFARGIGFGIVFLAFFSLIVFLLWNWLMPAIFGLTAINYFQAVGILILTKILLFGFNKRVGPWDHRKAREYWRKRFEEEQKSAGENPGEGTV
jgi:hypothetical protein